MEVSGYWRWGGQSANYCNSPLGGRDDGEPHLGSKNWVSGKGEQRNILEVKASGPKKIETE